MSQLDLMALTYPAPTGASWKTEAAFFSALK